MGIRTTGRLSPVALLGLLVFFVFSQAAVAQSKIALSPGDPKEIPIWNGAAPGSENWTQQETVSPFAQGLLQVTRNVTRPTITAYLPTPSTATGAAVIVCPGGGFHFLAMEHEGHAVARYLNSIGVAAFVLKYRVIETSDDFASELARFLSDREKWAEVMRPIQQLAGDDGRQAIRLVRANAPDWNISPDRIGIIGFSAGGILTLSVMLEHDAESRPDFAGSVYAGAFSEVSAPAGAMPLFVLHASDDPLVPAESSVRLYTAWRQAQVPAELHIFSRGGHGFGMNKQSLPVDHWADRFREWLDVQGLLQRAQEQAGK